MPVASEVVNRVDWIQLPSRLHAVEYARHQPRDEARCKVLHSEPENITSCTLSTMQ